MTAATLTELVSIEDYLAGELASEIKHEYLGGYIYAMAGARNIHNSIAGAWYGALYRQLLGKPCEPFNSDTKVRVSLSTHTRFYYPDGMVVCDSNPDEESFQDKPVVIAEVISKSTRRTDEFEKRDAYFTIPTLSVYMLIETDRPRVVVHRRAGDEFVAEVYEGTEAVIPLDVIEAELPLAELYARVEFRHSPQSDS